MSPGEPPVAKDSHMNYVLDVNRWLMCSEHISEQALIMYHTAEDISCQSSIITRVTWLVSTMLMNNMFF